MLYEAFLWKMVLNGGGRSSTTQGTLYDGRGSLMMEGEPLALRPTGLRVGLECMSKQTWTQPLLPFPPQTKLVQTPRYTPHPSIRCPIRTNRNGGHSHRDGALSPNWVVGVCLSLRARTGSRNGDMLRQKRSHTITDKNIPKQPRKGIFMYCNEACSST